MVLSWKPCKGLAAVELTQPAGAMVCKLLAFSKLVWNTHGGLYRAKRGTPLAISLSSILGCNEKAVLGDGIICRQHFSVRGSTVLCSINTS